MAVEFGRFTTASGDVSKLHLRWLNAPPADRWTLLTQDGPPRLRVAPKSGTDFWSRTHYGFVHDNGSFLGMETACADVELSLNVNFDGKNQYDQAGIMIRLDSDHWLKASVEYESAHEPARLGVVVTNAGFSDWSTQDVDQRLTFAGFRAIVKGADVVVECRLQRDQPWRQLRMAHLARAPGSDLHLGLYACCPVAEGFEAIFDEVNVRVL